LPGEAEDVVVVSPGGSHIRSIVSKRQATHPLDPGCVAWADESVRG
jgi:hypothetical protein